jgi:hypothetical protein
MAFVAGGVAHDFNNLMTIVVGNLDSIEWRLARFQPETVAAICRPIAAALQGARRAASLTQRPLAFSCQQVLTLQQVDLNRLVGASPTCWPAQSARRSRGAFHARQVDFGVVPWLSLL